MQVDIKKVLAYSTISQLGYMVLGVGVGAFAAAFLHLLTHACFKACLFLCSGSVIHSVHTQDMREMGGLRTKMPMTFACDVDRDAGDQRVAVLLRFLSVRTASSPAPWRSAWSTTSTC